MNHAMHARPHLTGFSLRVTKERTEAAFAREEVRFSASGSRCEFEHRCGDAYISLCLLAPRTAAFAHTVSFDGDSFALVLGEIFVLSDEEQTPATPASAHRLLETYQREGVAAFAGWSGDGAVILCDSDRMILIAPKTPGTTIYIKQGGDRGLYIASEIKALAGGSPALRHPMPDEAAWYRQPWMTSFRDVESVCAGHYIEIETRHRLSWKRLPYWSPNRTMDLTTISEAKAALRKALETSIRRVQAAQITSFISGGLDSSVVTAMAGKRGHIKAYSVGTPARNEFFHARKFADYVDADYQELSVEGQSLIQAFARTIYAVEHHHSTYLEYLSPGVLAHEVADVEDAVEISGYGSDVLFGGFAKPRDSLQHIARLINDEYRTALWANESSHVLGAMSNTRIHYPFFSPEVIEVAFRIPPSLKFKHGWEKWILRQVAEDLLPEDIAWRRKIGIHESTGTESFLTEYLGLTHRENGAHTNTTTNSDRQRVRAAKDNFCLSLLHQLFIERRSIREVEVVLEHSGGPLGITRGTFHSGHA